MALTRWQGGHRPGWNLYGTTNMGAVEAAAPRMAAVPFSGSPPPTACKAAVCLVRERALYIAGPPHNDGGAPQGDLTFDQSGNIYGTTGYGGADNYGVIYD